MATRNQVLSLFGASPEQILEQRRREQAMEVLKQSDPYQRAGSAIGVGLARMFGGEPAEVTRQRELYSMLEGVNFESPEQMRQAAATLQSQFPDRALQLISMAEASEAKQQDIATSKARQQASEAELRRGQFERGVTTESVQVEVGGETISVPVQVETKINRDTQDVTVTTTEEQKQARAKQLAQKLVTEKDATARAKILDEIKLQNARNERDLIAKQSAAADRKATETQGLAWVPFERIEIDSVTQRPKKVTGHEYKAVTGRMVKDKFVPNLQALPEGAKVVDEKTGIPEGMSKVDPTKTTQYTIGGTPVIKVGQETFIAHTIQGQTYYDPSKPVDAEAVRQEANQIAQQPVPQQPQSALSTRVSNRLTERPNATAADRTVGMIQQITGQ